MSGRKHVVIVVACLFSTCFIKAQTGTDFPAPYDNPNQLFYLQRTPDANTVVYELNCKNGGLDTSEPVHVYWIRYSEKGQHTELNSVQRKFAYGLKAKALSPGLFELRFVSSRNVVMYLKKGTGERYYVYTLINRKEAILNRVFLKINGGSFWSPKIEYVDLKGTDPVSCLVVSERLKLSNK